MAQDLRCQQDACRPYAVQSKCKKQLLSLDRYPLGAREKAVAETTTGTWDVHLHRDDHSIETRPTDIPTGSEDTEAVARAITAALLD